MKMSHPEIEAAGDVRDREQFNMVYAPRGWVLMDEPTEYANGQLGRFIRDANAGEGAGGLTKDEARALIAARGGDYPEENATGAEVLDAYLSSFGPRPPRPAAATESPAGIPVKLYDPSDYNVDEVVTYLESADEGERERVQDAEAKGKNRVTITGWAPATDDSATADDQNQEA